MPFAVVLILLVVGSILFHLLSPWTFTPLASNWAMVDVTVDITLYVTGLIFVAVNLFMAYCVIKFRYKEGARSTYEPENTKLENWLTFLTALGVVAMLTPGLFVWAQFVDVPEEAHEVEVVGQQWHWTYRYPGADGKFGEVDNERIAPDNPFGMDPDDPNGQDDVLVYNPEAHLPQFGGFCAFGVFVGKKLDGDVRFADIVDGKLYLFVNAAIFEKYLEDKAAVIEGAHEKWPGIVNTPVSDL